MSTKRSKPTQSFTQLNMEAPHIVENRLKFYEFKKE